MRATERGAILVEAAIVLPVLLLLTFGVLGVERVLHAQAGVQAAAHDAARAGALAPSADDAARRGAVAALATATDYSLDVQRLALTVDTSAFGRGGQVVARADYTVRFTDLPFLNWAEVEVRASDRQPVDRFRAIAGGQQ